MMYEAEDILIGREQVQPTSQDVEAILFVDNPQDAYIFHEHPFGNIVSWIEYDLSSGRIDFIMEDGELKNYGVPVPANLGTYLQNIHHICLAHKDGEDIVSENILPLITHH